MYAYILQESTFTEFFKAKTIDKELANGMDRGLLAGIPIAIKVDRPDNKFSCFISHP